MEHPSDLLKRIVEDVGFRAGIVESEGRTGGGRDTKVSHHWLRTVVTGANGDPAVVENGPDIVRMNPFQHEPKNTRFVRGSAYEPDAFHVRQAFCRITEQLLLPR